MTRLECPYCQSNLEDPDDCWETDQTYELQCTYCEKEFVFHVDYTINYYPRQAACLNGADHEEVRTKTYPPKYSRMRCRTCGREREMTSAERDAVATAVSEVTA